MKKRIYFFTGTLMSMLMTAASATPLTFSSPHEVMVKTIKEGKVSGMMVGEVAEQFTRQFRSEGALWVESSVIKSFKRVDCKRLQVNFKKMDVKTPQGLTNALLKTQINYCLDGKPPIPAE
jgi:hypothetical protein